MYNSAYITHRLGRTGQPVEENVGDFGNIEERQSLRASLNCKDFGWYISKVTNQSKHKSHAHLKVATSLWEPHIVGMGEVWNPHHGFCLDQQDGATNVGLPLLVFDCHGEKGNQYWYYRSDGTLGHDLLCVVEKQEVDKETAPAAEQSPLMLGPCRSEKERVKAFSEHFDNVGANEIITGVQTNGIMKREVDC